MTEPTAQDIEAGKRLDAARREEANRVWRNLREAHRPETHGRDRCCEFAKEMLDTIRYLEGEKIRILRAAFGLARILGRFAETQPSDTLSECRHEAERLLQILESAFR